MWSNSILTPGLELRCVLWSGLPPFSLARTYIVEKQLYRTNRQTHRQTPSIEQGEGHWHSSLFTLLCFVPGVFSSISLLLDACTHRYRHIFWQIKISVFYSIKYLASGGYWILFFFFQHCSSVVKVVCHACVLSVPIPLNLISQVRGT